MEQQNPGTGLQTPAWLADELKECMQCGTCSGVCPVATYSDSAGPRKLFALLSSGETLKALGSDHLWLCTSCQACTDNCPKKLHTSSMVGGLKQMALDHGYAPGGDAQVRMVRNFADIVEHGGRISEFSLMRRVLGFRPGPILRNTPLAMKLMSHGRLKMTGHGIEHPDELTKMFEKMEAHDAK
jgi:heterodisulfide reductase subunit C